MDVILPALFDKVLGEEEEKEAEDICDVLRSKPISNPHSNLIETVAKPH